jgi:hypothetical protein
VLSKTGNICRIKAGSLNTVSNNGKKVKVTKYPDGSIGFGTKPGDSYKITGN